MNWQQWFVARGRIPRRVLVLHYVAPIVGAMYLAAWLDHLLGAAESVDPWISYGPLARLTGSLLVVPLITAMVARLHDRGDSAWALLLLLLPVLGWGLLLVQLLVLPGHPWPNRYGHVPGRPETVWVDGRWIYSPSAVDISARNWSSSSSPLPRAAISPASSWTGTTDSR